MKRDSGTTERSRFTSPTSVLRIRRFSAFWVAGAASSIGTWVHRTVAMVLVWELTGSALAVGLLATAATLPVLLFALAAGAASDRFDRRRIIIVAHLASAGAALALAAFHATGGRAAAAPIAVAFVMAVSWAFAKPALSAYFPALVPPDALRAAIAANSMNFIAGQVIGPIIGTLFLAAGQMSLAFAVNAVSFLIPVVVMARLPAVPIERREPAQPATRWSSLREALPPANVALLTVVAISAGAADVLRNLSPVVVAAVGADQGFTGIVVTAVSLGSGLGTMTAGFVASRLGEARGAATGLAVQGAALLLLAASFSQATVLVAAAGTGLGFSWSFIILTSELQGRTRDGLRGRVMALHSLAHMGVRPSTTLLTSAVAGAFGAVVAVAGNGLLAMGTIALISASFAGQRTTAGRRSTPEPVEG